MLKSAKSFYKLVKSKKNNKFRKSSRKTSRKVNRKTSRKVNRNKKMKGG